MGITVGNMDNTVGGWDAGRPMNAFDRGIGIDAALRLDEGMPIGRVAWVMGLSLDYLQWVLSHDLSADYPEPDWA